MKTGKLLFLGALAMAAVVAVVVWSREGSAPELQARFADLDARFASSPEAPPGEPVTNDSDEYALESIDLGLKDLMADLEEAFEGKDAEAVGALVTDDFRGSSFGDLVEVTSGVAERDSGPSENWVDEREALVRELGDFFDRFQYVYEAFFKVKEYFDGQVFTERVGCKVKLDLRGKRADGSVHQEFVYWKCALAKAGETWKIDRAFLIERHQSASREPLFTEITSASGLYVTEPPDRAVTGIGNISPIDRQQGTNFDYGGVCVYDVDGDGDLDIFMPNAYGAFALYVNQGDGTFVDEAARRGIDGSGGARGAVFGDADNDGDPDLYVCRGPFHTDDIRAETNLFYENVGEGRFREVTERAGLELVGSSMSATFLDYDRDGYLDLFVANYGDGKSEGESHPFHATNGIANKLYRNRGDGTFEDVSTAAGVGAETFWSYAVAVCDWNKDGHPDIYVANDFGPNNFYVSQGDGTFRDLAKQLAIEDVGNGMGAAFVDYDHDADWDLYVVNMQSGTGRRVLSAAKKVVTAERDFQYLWKLTLGNSFFELEDGKFLSKGKDLGIADSGWGWHADFFDYDADGDRDLLVMNGYFSGAEKKDC